MNPSPPSPDDRAGRRALKAILNEQSPLAALEALHHELGDVFRIPLPGFNPVVLAGPQAARFVLVDRREGLRWRTAGDPVTRLLRHGLLVEDGSSHDALRRQIAPALHRRAVSGYVERMWRRTDEVAVRWDDDRPIDMLVEMRRAALLILMDTLFGVDFHDPMGTLWKPILRLLRFISPGPWILWPSAPRLGYRSARRAMDDYLYRLIRSRRAADRSDDLLGLLIHDAGLSDDLVRDQLLTLLIAGHDTSTAALAWTLYNLGKHPEWMARARSEVDAVLRTEPPDESRLGQLVSLENAINEALRLYPPIHVSMRTAAMDLAFDGYRIPAGARLMFSIYLTHRHPALWDDPGRFDPNRFNRTGSNRIGPYTFLPFGGGPRNCIGAAFARVETKVVLARLLQTFDLDLLDDRVHPHMGATLEPRPAVWMTAQRRPLADWIPNGPRGEPT